MDVFNYIYAILHSRSYRARYDEFLRLDYPCIPFTTNLNLFGDLAKKGASLVQVHTMQASSLQKSVPVFPESGSDVISEVRHDLKRVWINKKQYFEVEAPVWKFFIGGYQVCERWLAERKGRTLVWNDIQHYWQITEAVRQTISLMVLCVCPLQRPDQFFLLPFGTYCRMGAVLQHGDTESDRLGVLSGKGEGR